MSMMRFYVSHLGQQMGPWAFDEIIRSLDQEKLLWSDYLYDEKLTEWILIADHPYFQDFYQKWLQLRVNVKEIPTPDANQVKELQYNSAENNPNKQVKEFPEEWFILKGDNKFGPFTYLDLVRMLQHKNLYEFDYVWNVNMKGWRRVAECKEFSEDAIKKLKTEVYPEIEQVFFRRRHARVKYGASVVIHNSKTVWRGQSLEISSGGAGLLIDSSRIEPGQTLFLHFKVGDGVPPFNAICNVVSKQFLSESSKQVRYGVKFTNISREVQFAIKSYTEKKIA